jgi:hypothetical protein
VADDDSVYVVQRDRCHRLDQTTGRIVSTHRIPDAVVKGVSPAETDYLDIEWPKVWRVIGPLPGGALSFPARLVAPSPLRVLPGGGRLLRWGEAQGFTVQGVFSILNSVN